MATKRSRGRKLLVASMGLATVSYVGCSGSSHPSQKNPPVGPVGNLMGVPTLDGGSRDGATDTAMAGMGVGNLMAPPQDSGVVREAATDSGMAGMGVGNLMAPPQDSGVGDQ